jgi:hypothetical protein
MSVRIKKKGKLKKLNTRIPLPKKPPKVMEDGKTYDRKINKKIDLDEFQ